MRTAKPSSPLPHPDFGGLAAPLPAIGLGQWLAERADRDAQRPALSFEGRTWRYGELQNEVERMAAVLQAGGVGEGTRVAYLGFNHPMFFFGLFAAARLGAIFVPLNFRLTGPELEYIINDAGAQTLIVDAHHVGAIEPVRTRLVCQTFWLAHGERPATATAADWPDLGAALREAQALKRPAVAVDQNDVALIMYTSGTTGQPKGAMLTHGNFWWNHVNELLTIGSSSNDVLLVFAPVYHIGGLNVMTLTTLLMGGHVVLQRQFDPGAVLRDLVAYQVRKVFVVPAMLLFISQHPDFARADLSTLKLISCGGAPCPEPLLQLFNARGIAVQQGYGLTETAALATTLTAEWAASKLGSVGKPPLLTQVRALDANDQVITEPGARGEICVRGQNVTRGYWNKPEATAAALDDQGWFRTGDVGYFDADGFWYICDRVKDMIISGGENVYPAEVESVLHAHPAVAEVAVIGAPDEKWGETVLAVVALKPGQTLTLESLQDHASQSLARYKIPRRLELLPALPRNPTGKILKYQLREKFNPR